MENPDPELRPPPRQPWLARLSFSFLIIALYLAYRGYRGDQDHTFSRGRVILCYFSSMLGFVLFVAGTRQRHRRD